MIEGQISEGQRDPLEFKLEKSEISDLQPKRNLESESFLHKDNREKLGGHLEDPNLIPTLEGCKDLAEKTTVLVTKEIADLENSNKIEISNVVFQNSGKKVEADFPAKHMISTQRNDGTLVQQSRNLLRILDC